MTWLDITLIVLLVLFIAVGARLGSLWTAGCLVGGFVGAYLVDTYALPVSGMMNAFRGSEWIATGLLFAAGVLVVTLPAWILSRICSGIFLGVVDSAFGFLTGGLAALFAVTLILLVVVPVFPKVESASAWKKSVMVKPLHVYLEEFFNDPHFHATAELKSAADKLVDDLKKK